MGAYSRWALIRGWALIRINTVARLDDTSIYVIFDLLISSSKIVQAVFVPSRSLVTSV